jgi:glycosyltransferase involved in cell wall biosynthesis
MSTGRPRVALFSPVRPMRSGISDYTEELLPQLSEHWDLCLFVNGYRPDSEVVRRLPVFDCAESDPLELLPSFDATVYHMGNSPCHGYIYDLLQRWPGLVVLHEVSIHHFLADRFLSAGRAPDYLKELRLQHGDSAAERGRRTLWAGEAAQWESEPLKCPMNRRVIAAAAAIVAHSDFVASWVRERRSDIPIYRVDHHAFPPSLYLPNAGCDDPDDSVLRIVTAGHLNPNKRVDAVLRAVARVGEQFRVRYELLGEVAPVWDLQALAHKLGVDDRVQIHGHVSREEIYRQLLTADLCVALRMPTLGETSGIAMRALACGLPLIVSDAGWFAELPDSFAIKIPATDDIDRRLAVILGELAGDRSRLKRMSAAALDFARQRTPGRQAAAYADVVRHAELAPRHIAGRELLRVTARARQMGIESALRAGRRAAARMTELCGLATSDTVDPLNATRAFRADR